jgi:hypothetical protein
MNEPKAWWHYKSFDLIWNDVYEELIEGKEEWIPLYDHPIRELTDKEIKAIVYTYWTEKYDVDLFGFARALLKKASEK